jgi:hypothetical protein
VPGQLVTTSFWVILNSYNKWINLVPGQLVTTAYLIHDVLLETLNL